METAAENETLANYLTALQKASSDNERFAALLMIAKVSKATTCTVEVKRQILDAVGGKFISRLLKTKNVPEDCSASIYKSVAMSVLSALCKDPDVACSPTLTDNVASFNNILLLDPDEADAEGRQLVTDTYECVNSLCGTAEGLESLKRPSTVSALCGVVASHSYGWEKGQDVLLCLVSRYGGGLFKGCESSYHSVVASIARQFQDDQSLKKFELCKTLVFLLTAVPNMLKEGEPPWVTYIVGGLDNILRSKVGKSQREPALRLASMLVDACGMSSLLPPETADNKLFLLTTHLCCVEVRMVLEDPDMTRFQSIENGRLLSSCYSFLECVINYMTGGPTLALDDRQVLQLHAAMAGAFSAVIHFLKRVSDDSSIQWNSTILASVRVLAAWLSEETSALKDEIYELIPFLIQISKLCVPPEKEVSIDDAVLADQRTKSTSEPSDSEDKPAHCEVVEMKDDSEAEAMDTDKLASSFEKGVSVESSEQAMESDISENGPNSGCSNVDVQSNPAPNSCDMEQDEMSVDNELKIGETDVDALNFTDKTDIKPQKTDSGNKKQVTFTEDNQTIDSNSSEMKPNSDKTTKNSEETLNKPRDLYSLESVSADKEVLSEKEIIELHVRADVFHFLLPALCHFTADEVPRRLLLECGTVSLLDLYMWRKWESFITNPTGRDAQSALLVLCNIFLNFTIVEPACITHYPEFAHILLLAVKGVAAMELNESHIGLWSHLVTLGLMLLRQLHKKAAEILEAESLVTFYASSVKYLSGAYRVKHRKKGHGMLELVDDYRNNWDQISQTWFLSMQALSACIPLREDIPATILKAGWLPAALKNLQEVKANSVPEEVRSCYLLLFTTLAKKDEAAKTVILEKGGIDFARSYKAKELLELLQA